MNCKIEGCEQPVRYKRASLCKMHYLQLWRTENRDKEKEYQERYKDQQKKNYLKHRKERLKKSKERAMQKAEEIKIYKHEYNIKNRRKITQSRQGYYKKRAEHDLNYRLRTIVRTRIKNALKNNLKSKRSAELLGIGLDDYKKYLEAKFTSDPITGEVMNWNNWNFTGWHIDHIKPLASFNLEDKSEQEKAFHYTNTQPLWSLDNLRKGDRQ